MTQTWKLKATLSAVHTQWWIQISWFHHLFYLQHCHCKLTDATLRCFEFTNTARSFRWSAQGSSRKSRIQPSSNSSNKTKNNQSMKIKTLKKTATCNQRKHLSYFNWECTNRWGMVDKVAWRYFSRVCHRGMSIENNCLIEKTITNISIMWQIMHPSIKHKLNVKQDCIHNLNPFNLTY